MMSSQYELIDDAKVHDPLGSSFKQIHFKMKSKPWNTTLFGGALSTVSNLTK